MYSLMSRASNLSKTVTMWTGCKAPRFLTSRSCTYSTLDGSTLCFGDTAPVQSNAVGSLRSPPPRRLPIIAGRTLHGKARIRFVSFILIYCFCRKIWNVPTGPKQFSRHVSIRTSISIHAGLCVPEGNVFSFVFLKETFLALCFWRKRF